jgi:cold shock CspA family protein
MNGTISRVISGKGFGFIQSDDGQEYFMHRGAVRDGSVFEQLREDETVVFDAGRGDKRLRAGTFGSPQQREAADRECTPNWSF